MGEPPGALEGQVEAMERATPQRRSFGGGEAQSGELDSLRRQAVTQARELAILRWELAALLQRQPIFGRATALKYFLLRKFPKFIQRASRAKRLAYGLLGAARRGKTIPDGAGAKTAVSRHPDGAQILLMDQSPAALKIAGDANPQWVISVSPGAGPGRSVPVPQAGEPPLRAPLPGSLAAWLVEDPGKLRRIDTLVLDAGDDVSLSLVRGRLAANQHVVLTHSTGITSPLVAELGAPDRQEAGAAHYSRPPLIWLDPLDEQLLTRRGGRRASAVAKDLGRDGQLPIRRHFLEEGIRSVLDQTIRTSNSS